MCTRVIASFVTDSVTPCAVVLSVGFSRRENWSGLPCPPPQGLPDPGVEPESPASPALQVGFLPSESPGKPQVQMTRF